VAINDWLCSDLFIRLHKSQPKVVDKKQDDDTVVKTIVIGVDGLPEIEETVVGVSSSN
jgi:hypothetical protein